MNTTTKTLAALTGLALVTGSAHAATIIYNFDGGDVAQANNITVSAAGNSSNTFSSGVTISDWSVSSPSREVFVNGGQVRAKKSDDTDTHTFTITISDTVILDLTSLSFDYGNVGPDTAPANFLVSTDAGGSFTNNPATHATGTFSGNVAMAISGLTGLTDTTITFTFADSAGGNNKNTTMYTFIDNVTLTGSESVVPEPGSLALLGLGGLMIARRRRG